MSLLILALKVLCCPIIFDQLTNVLIKCDSVVSVSRCTSGLMSPSINSGRNRKECFATSNVALHLNNLKDKEVLPDGKES